MGNGKKFYILSAALLYTNWGILCWILYRHAMYCSCTLACTVPWPIATDTDRVELLHTHNRENKGRNQGKLLKSPWTLSLHLLNIMKIATWDIFPQVSKRCDVGHIPSSLQAMRCGAYSLKSPSDAMWSIFPQISKSKFIKSTFIQNNRLNMTLLLRIFLG